MRKINLLFALACVMLLMTACNGKNSPDPEFLENDDITLVVNGTLMFAYSDLTCQSAFNRTKRQFSAGTDTMSSYFTLTVPEIPSSEGQTLDGCTLFWTKAASTKSMPNLSFTVKQIRQDGKVWLWSKKNKVAIVVQIL